MWSAQSQAWDTRTTRRAATQFDTGRRTLTFRHYLGQYPNMGKQPSSAHLSGSRAVNTQNIPASHPVKRSNTRRYKCHGGYNNHDDLMSLMVVVIFGRDTRCTVGFKVRVQTIGATPNTHRVGKWDMLPTLHTPTSTEALATAPLPDSSFLSPSHPPFQESCSSSSNP